MTVEAAALVQIAVAVAASGALAAVVTGILNRRKLSAEATKIITDAAASTVEQIEKDNKRLRERVEQLEAAELAWRRERADWRDVLTLHAAFDHLAVAKLREHGINDMPSPPPLYPPQFITPTGNGEH